MKKNILATALLLIPSYLFFSWIYLNNAFAEKTQPELVAIYQSDFIQLNIDFAYLALVGFIASVLATVLLIGGNEMKSTGIKIYSYILATFAMILAAILLGWMM